MNDVLFMKCSSDAFYIMLELCKRRREEEQTVLIAQKSNNAEKISETKD